MLKFLKNSLIISVSALAICACSATASEENVFYTTVIDGRKQVLNPPTRDPIEHKKTLQQLEQAMIESNQLTAQYLKTNSPVWKDLMTDELKANIITFDNTWKRIVIDRHYNKDVLNTYEKYQAAQLANRDKMYAHFFAISTNDPFKEKVKDTVKVNKNHFLNKQAAIKRLKTFL